MKNKILGIAVLTLVLANCSHKAVEHESNRDPARGATATDNLLNFDLYKNEAWKGGSREAEEKEFIGHFNDVRAAQAKLQSDSKAAHGDRVFHQKDHGCYVGTLEILPDRPLDPEKKTFRGMFASADKYKVLVRFSNGVGLSQDDHKPDVRGIGVKIFNVKDEATGELKTVDFTGTNSQIPFGKDQAQFVEFMKANVWPGVAMSHTLAFVAKHFSPVGLQIIKRTMLHKVKSLSTETFWSGHPYLLGKDEAMKFNLRPMSPDAVSYEPYETNPIATSNKRVKELENAFYKKKNKSPNYLTEDLAKMYKLTGYLMSLQLDQDDERTPIENATEEWTEKRSPSIPVGVLKLVAPFPTDKCNEARFTPGHWVSQHRPAGNLARGRLFTYLASATGRPSRANELSLDEILPYFNEK